MLKSAEEIMQMLEAFDLTGSLRDAAELADCSHHAVARYVQSRDAGGVIDQPARRPQLIDDFLPKLEEWMEHSKGKIRADVAHDKLLALGYQGSERTTRRATEAVRTAFKAGRVRVHRPWVTEPGMWLQYDFGDGPDPCHVNLKARAPKCCSVDPRVSLAELPLADGGA